jgi:anti-sigma28 factor (negative regulator of flagellin synthesis)
MYVLLSIKVRVATSKILRVCNRGGVPLAYPTLKNEIIADAKEKINGGTYSADTSKVSNY